MQTRNRALIYVRKSLVRTGSDTVSPERQRAACLAEAEHHGWLVSEADIYTDAEGHQSGKNDNRPGWQALRHRLARDTSVAAVIVESLSRASRNVRSFLAFVDECRAHGVALVSLKERFDTSTAIGQAMLGFIAIIGQLESDLAAERMKGQIAFKKSRGRHWGLTPMGCEREPVTGALKPSSETFPFDGTERTYHESLRRCYELYAGGDMGLKATANLLNAEGWRFRGRDGEPRDWSGDNLRGVVALNRVYAGEIPTSGGANKDRRDVEYLPANYQPILPPDLCRRVDEVWRWRPSVSHPDPAGTPSDYILTGLLRCGHCGSRLKGYRRGGHRYYRHALRGDCPLTWQDADSLETHALDLLRGLSIPDEVAEHLVTVVLPELSNDNSAELDAEIQALSESMRSAEAELDRLVKLAIATELAASTYSRNVTELNRRIEALGQQRFELEQRARQERDTVAEVVDRLRHVADLVQTQDPALQRELLRSVFSRIVVDTAGMKEATPREWCRPFLGSPGQ